MMTVREEFERVKAFKCHFEKESKATLIEVLGNLLWDAATTGYLFGQDRETAWKNAEERFLKQLKECRKTGLLVNQTKRVTSIRAVIAEALKKGGDCNDCEFWRERGARKAGKRIPGGIGKCTREGGHCRPEKVRK